uniref:Protein FAR1-RELATED SEQUENCE n=1 Tax=Hordeum vulgare subsp. vulgare TaxID=112509 RepID=A0A8I7BIW1_HORVV
MSCNLVVKSNGEPMLNTQSTPHLFKATIVEFVHESTNPAATQNFAAPKVEAVQTEEHTLDDTNTIGGTRGTIGNEGTIEGVVNDDEGWSQPKDPSLGMRFHTLEGAKEHYNAYSLLMGFSIKMHMSRRSDITGEIEKYQFVCNKFRNPKYNDQGAKTTPIVHLVGYASEGAEDDDFIIFSNDAIEQKKKR